MIRALATVPLLVALAGCMLDFNAAIPCDDDTQCPTGGTCDLVVRRCLTGREAPEPDAEAPEEDAGRTDTGGRPLPPRDTGLDDADGDADLDTDLDADPDGSGVPTDVEPPTDVPDEGDTGPVSDADVEACIPSPEICDGLDNDCDGDIDEDGVCGEGCGPDMVQIVADGVTPFCIDRWEASRPDATATAEGSDNTRATSREGVLPWRFVTLEQAEQACTAASRRLCTAAEWQLACAGIETWSYPYNARIYDGTKCNGLNTPPLNGPSPTGSFTECVSPFGVHDMSGNVGEWTSARFTSGGAWDSVSQNLRCTSENRAVNPTISEPQAGFRCCR
jgi:hypothetical protein